MTSRGRHPVSVRVVALGAVMLVLGAGFAYAVIASRALNTVTTPALTVAVEEGTDGEHYEGWTDPGTQWGATVPKYVRFTNTGQAHVVMRVSYAQAWTLETTEGGVPVTKQLSNTYRTETAEYAVATLDWTSAGLLNTDLWFDGGDGWYYYRHVLAPGESSDAVLASVTFVEPAPYGYDGAEYQLRFITESCQYSTNLLNKNQEAVWTTFGMTYEEVGGALVWSQTAPGV
ncbi:MAG: hypothetical protein K0B85_01050 [Coriobacteriia bacterium]|nr:hypothetical protein [Coriobacteriia bacterium]